MSTTFLMKPSLLASLILVTLGPACGGSNTPVIGDQHDPSHVYCETNHGTIELWTSPTDGHYSICKFGETSECESWAFFRGECKPGDCTKWETCKPGADVVTADSSPAIPSPCGDACMPNPASVNCTAKGGTLDIRTATAGQYGVCKFGRGSECEEWAFFRGECKPGDCSNWEICKSWF